MYTSRITTTEWKDRVTNKKAKNQEHELERMKMSNYPLPNKGTVQRCRTQSAMNTVDDTQEKADVMKDA